MLDDLLDDDELLDDGLGDLLLDTERAAASRWYAEALAESTAYQAHLLKLRRANQLIEAGRPLKALLLLRDLEGAEDLIGLQHRALLLLAELGELP